MSKEYVKSNEPAADVINELAEHIKQAHLELIVGFARAWAKGYTHEHHRLLVMASAIGDVEKVFKKKFNIGLDK